MSTWYIQAVILLRNNAAEKNANVVRIDAEEEQGEVEGNAVRRRYVILGVAFRCP